MKRLKTILGLAANAIFLYIAYRAGLDANAIIRTMIVEGYVVIGLNALPSLRYIGFYKDAPGLKARIVLIIVSLGFTTAALLGHWFFLKQILTGIPIEYHSSVWSWWPLFVTVVLTIWTVVSIYLSRPDLHQENGIMNLSSSMTVGLFIYPWFRMIFFNLVLALVSVVLEGKAEIRTPTDVMYAYLITDVFFSFRHAIYWGLMFFTGVDTPL